MALEPPTGFVDLYTASNQLNRDINVIGVVTDVLPSSRSRGTDWILTFSISDLTIVGYGYGQKVRFFKPNAAELPAIQGTGDVIILWNVKVKEWSGMSIVMSNHATSWLVFPSSSIPEKPPSSGVQLKHLKAARTPSLTRAEMLYAISLCNSQDRGTFSALIPPNVEDKSVLSSGPSPSVTGPRQKFSLIKDMVVETYYDLVGQVVKMYPDNGKVELYLTDYTTNGLLYNYEWGRDNENAEGRECDPHGHIPRGISKKWRGPYGKMTLTVTLWNPHAYYTQTNVKEDQFVFLRNVHIKWSRDAKVEGALHTDNRYPGRIDISILDIQDDRVKDVLRRKRDYAAKFKMQSEEFVGEARGQKRKKDAEGEALSKNQLRKRRKQQKELAKREQSKPEEDGQNGDDESFSRATIFPKLELNRNITCSNPSVPTRTLSSILSREKTHAHTSPNGTPCTLPFQNVCSRSTVRVVDFFPHKLEDFAVRHRVTEFEDLSDNDDGTEGDSSNYSSDETSENGSPDERKGTKWEWRFSLLLEDASSISKQPQEKERIKVFVAGADAEFLTKMDAVNLHQDLEALATLREKLFILWGDLEERKTRKGLKESEATQQGKLSTENERPDQQSGTAARAPAFQCCLKEYGIRQRIMDGKNVLASDGEEDGEKTYTWERAFRMFGTTIK